MVDYCMVCGAAMDVTDNGQSYCPGGPHRSSKDRAEIDRLRKEKEQAERERDEARFTAAAILLAGDDSTAGSIRETALKWLAEREEAQARVKELEAALHNLVSNPVVYGRSARIRDEANERCVPDAYAAAGSALRPHGLVCEVRTAGEGYKDAL